MKVWHACFRLSNEWVPGRVCDFDKVGLMKGDDMCWFIGMPHKKDGALLLLVSCWKLKIAVLVMFLFLATFYVVLNAANAYMYSPQIS